MIITAITPQKNDSGRRSIFVDGQFAFSLIQEDVAYFKLKENGEISQKTYDYITQKLLYIKAQDTALQYIGFQMRTAFQVRQKLQDKEYAENVIEEVMTFLLKYKYVDDEDYCRRYIRQRQRLSPRGAYALKAELRQKGVADSIIEKAVDESGLDEIEAACRLIAKKCRRLENIDEKSKKRLWGFLQRRGFSYDIIKEAFKAFEDSDF